MIRLETLGQLRGFLNGQEVSGMPNRRRRFALLVYMAVERMATRQSLCRVFWTDSDESRAKGALKQTIFELRQALGAEVLETSGEKVTITNDLQIDTNDFSKAVE